MSNSDETLAEALKAWSQGNQQGAVDLVKPLADEGDSAGLLAICWFLHQMGDPKWREGIPYAKRAAEQGNPWIPSFFFGQLVEDPATRTDAIELIRLSPTGGFNSNDPIGRAMEFANGDDAASAAEMLRAAAGPHNWPPDLEEARRKATELGQIHSEVDGRRDQVLSDLESASKELVQAQEDFKTREGTLTKFLDNLTNVATEYEFEKQAQRYGKESIVFWVAGLSILFIAASAAVLPLILNYANPNHHALNGQSNVSAHLGAALAFAAVAGVLLARARNRDRDRQRNRDLSVALITMFAYSEQIANEQEKERFKHEMARLVLEAFLRQKPPTEEASRSVISEIVDPGGSSEQANAK